MSELRFQLKVLTTINQAVYDALSRCESRCLDDEEDKDAVRHEVTKEVYEAMVGMVGEEVGEPGRFDV